MVTSCPQPAPVRALSAKIGRKDDAKMRGSSKAGTRRAILFARHAVAEPRKVLALTTDDAEQGSDKSGSPGPRRVRVPRATGMTVALVLLVLGLTGCTNNTFTRLGFPNPITEQGKTALTIWQGSWIAAFAVAALVWGLILWAVIFHRKRGDKLPPQARYNMPIEIMYTAVPFVLIAVLFYFTAKDENYINKLSNNPDVVVNVLGFQWSWQFNYPQYHVTNIGDMYGEGPLPVLEIPTGETVRFNLTSEDVVHAFWIPEFLFKRDVIPDHPNHFEVTATQTGTFTGHCSELCGLYHSKMLFTVKVVTPQQFQADMAAEQAAQQASGSTS
jgi:cytochrome c oxidase subunit II